MTEQQKRELWAKARANAMGIIAPIKESNSEFDANLQFGKSGVAYLSNHQESLIERILQGSTLRVNWDA